MPAACPASVLNCPRARGGVPAGHKFFMQGANDPTDDPKISAGWAANWGGGRPKRSRNR